MNSGDTPLDQSTIEAASVAIGTAQGAKQSVPEMPEDTDAINAEATAMGSLGEYSAQLDAHSRSCAEPWCQSRRGGGRTLRIDVCRNVDSRRRETATMDTLQEGAPGGARRQGRRDARPHGPVGRQRRGGPEGVRWPQPQAA